MATIIERLIEDHRNIELLICVIEDEIKTFEAGERPDYEMVRMVLNYLLTYPDLGHHPIEDAIVQQLETRTTEHDVPGTSSLEIEHQRLASIIRRFLAAINNILADTMLPREWFSTIAHDFIKFQRKHMQMEEVIIFPAAKHTLTDEDWAKINIGISRQEDPIFGPNPDPAFAELRGYIDNK